MPYIAWSVCVCVGHMDVPCAKTAEAIVMPLGRLTHVSPRNHDLDGGSRSGESICSHEG